MIHLKSPQEVESHKLIVRKCFLEETFAHKIILFFIFFVSLQPYV